MIEQSNTVVANSGSVINRKTKVATNDFTLSDENSVVSLNKGTLATSRSRYHYGVNKVTYHWNYIRVYLNKNLTQAVASGAVGGVGTLIASYVTGGAATFAVGVISSSVDVLVTNGIKGGVCVIVPNLILILIFYKTVEFKFILNIIMVVNMNTMRKLEDIN